MISTALHTLSTTAQLIATGDAASVTDRPSALVSAPSADIYVGGPDVTTANGILVASGANLSVDLGPGDLLYAVASAGTPTVRVMTTRTGFVDPS